MQRLIQRPYCDDYFGSLLNLRKKVSVFFSDLVSGVAKQNLHSRVSSRTVCVPTGNLTSLAAASFAGSDAVLLLHLFQQFLASRFLNEA